VNDGPYGIDALNERNQEFSYSCRFPNRAFALAYAELERPSARATVAIPVCNEVSGNNAGPLIIERRDVEVSLILVRVPTAK
jgi:hypothetical protein